MLQRVDWACRGMCSFFPREGEESKQAVVKASSKTAVKAVAKSVAKEPGKVTKAYETKIAPGKTKNRLKATLVTGT